MFFYKIQNTALKIICKKPSKGNAKGTRLTVTYVWARVVKYAIGVIFQLFPLIHL